MLHSPPMVILTQRLAPDSKAIVQFTLSLTAEERTRSRHYFETEEKDPLYLQLPRGTVLKHGDLLRSNEGVLVRIVAKPEPVFTVIGHTPLELLRAAYHLGNRHVSLEVTESYLRLSPDPVLKGMIEQMGLHVEEAIVPFHPETGAYGNPAASTHSHPHHAH